MPAKPQSDFAQILRVLAAHKVDFIVVGGVCAVLHGAPIATFDLDIVHSRTPDNLGRLLPALAELKAHYRGQPDRYIKPDDSHVSSPGHQLLMTSAGPLDLLGAVSHGLGFAELLAHSSWIDLGAGLEVQLLSLEKLIELKEAAGREKDTAVLSVLKRTLEEGNR
jgi:predicted nucleotidyltransferase